MSVSSDVTRQSLFSISWPIFVDLLLHFSTLLINTYMVSHVSITALAAMGVGNQVFDLCITIFSFISVGCSVVIAQYLGAGNRDEARKAIHLSIAFNFLLGLMGAVLIFFFGNKVLVWMNMPPELRESGFAYLHILGICLIPEAIALILAACLRVHGRTKSVMYVSIIINIVTVFGNILVLYGLWGLPKLGLTGVAYSTVLGRMIGVLLLVYLLFGGLKIKIEWSLFIHWTKSLLGKILQIGLPAAGENLIWITQYTVALAFIGLLGESSLAAQTLYFQLSLFIMLFGIAISIGNEILIGHLVGARQFDQAYTRAITTLKLSVIATTAIVFCFWLFRYQILGFLSNDEQIIKLLLPVCLLSVFLEPGRTFNIVIVNALRAAGDARFPMFIGLIFMWGLALPLGYFLGVKMGMGILGVWISFLCDEWLRGIINFWRWRSRKWESKRLSI